jgi:hypothetical protein
MAERGRIDDEAISNSVLLGKALSHPVRALILRRMHGPQRRLSPSGFVTETEGITLSTASYHFRQLDQTFGCLEVVDTIRRRGALENIYFPVKRAMAWTQEWEDFGPHVKQKVAATALGGAVELIGEAIDAGTFENLPDSILAWDAVPMNLEGYKRLHAILERAIQELIALGDEYKELVKDMSPEEIFLVTYLISTFETPKPPEKN